MILDIKNNIQFRSFGFMFRQVCSVFRCENYIYLTGVGPSYTIYQLHLLKNNNLSFS